MHPTGVKDEVAADALWRFSLALYARPAVADALIRLQDRAGLDVNLILFGLWLGATQLREIGAAELATIVDDASGLAGVVSEIRTLRRRLGSAADADSRALRRRLLQLELGTERRVQRRLTATLTPPASATPGRDPLAAAETNLARYLEGEAGSAEAEVLRAALASLMRRRPQLRSC